MLVASGVGNAIGEMAVHAQLSPVLLAWLVAALIRIATGAGSLILSHVNDAGFWLVKQYFNMTVAETFKTWTAMETIISVVGIIFIMILAAFV